MCHAVVAACIRAGAIKVHSIKLLRQFQVIDLVAPSLFPLVAGVSRSIPVDHPRPSSVVYRTPRSPPVGRLTNAPLRSSSSRELQLDWDVDATPEYVDPEERQPCGAGATTSAMDAPRSKVVSRIDHEDISAASMAKLQAVRGQDQEADRSSELTTGEARAAQGKGRAHRCNSLTMLTTGHVARCVW